VKTDKEGRTSLTVDATVKGKKSFNKRKSTYGIGWGIAYGDEISPMTESYYALWDRNV